MISEQEILSLNWDSEPPMCSNEFLTSVQNFIRCQGFATHKQKKVIEGMLNSCADILEYELQIE